MCSTNERHMEKMKKWNQIYEWSKKVRTYFDRDCSASLVDEEDPVVRRVVTCLTRDICRRKGWNRNGLMRNLLLENCAGEIEGG